MEKNAFTQFNATIEPWDCESELQAIHVRITDSFLVCLEQMAIRKKGGSIELKCDSDTGGFFTIKGDTPEACKEFKFSCKQTAVKHETHHHLLCLKPKPNGKHLDLGEMNTFLQVHANEEVFGSTKDKLNAIEESKNRSKAKELHPMFNKKALKTSKSINYSKTIKNIMNRSNSSVSLKRSNGSLHKNTGIKLNNKQTLKPVNVISNEHLNSKSIQSYGMMPNSNINYSKYSIRKRILHILAIRPHNMTDLKARLQKEGIAEADYSMICQILKSLVKDYEKICNSSTVLMHLKSEWFSHIDLKWPLFSKLELQLVERNININKSQSSVTESLNYSTESKQKLNKKDNYLFTQSYIDKEKTNLIDEKKLAADSKFTVIQNNVQMNNSKSSISKRPLVDQNNDKFHNFLSSNTQTPSSSNNNGQFLLSKMEYESFVDEYNNIFPDYKELYDNIMVIREKFKSFHRKLKNIDVNDVDNTELIELKHKINVEHDQIDAKFSDDVNRLKKLHSRVAYLKKILKKHLDCAKSR